MEKVNYFIMLMLLVGCGSSMQQDEKPWPESSGELTRNNEQSLQPPSGKVAISEQDPHLSTEDFDWVIANFSLSQDHQRQLLDPAYADQAELAITYARQALEGERLVNGFNLIPGLERVGQLYQWYQLLSAARSLAAPLLENLQQVESEADAAASIVSQSDHRLRNLFSELISFGSNNSQAPSSSSSFELPSWQNLLMAILS